MAVGKLEISLYGFLSTIFYFVFSSKLKVVTPLKLTDAAQWTLVALGGAIALVAGFFLARIVFFSR